MMKTIYMIDYISNKLEENYSNLDSTSHRIFFVLNRFFYSLCLLNILIDVKEVVQDEPQARANAKNESDTPLIKYLQMTTVKEACGFEDGKVFYSSRMTPGNFRLSALNPRISIL